MALFIVIVWVVFLLSCRPVRHQSFTNHHLFINHQSSIDIHTCDLLRRRLGISLVIDTVEEFAADALYCVNVIAFFQELVRGKIVMIIHDNYNTDNHFSFFIFSLCHFVIFHFSFLYK